MTTHDALEQITITTWTCKLSEPNLLGGLFRMEGTRHLAVYKKPRMDFWMKEHCFDSYGYWTRFLRSILKECGYLYVCLRVLIDYLCHRVKIMDT